MINIDKHIETLKLKLLAELVSQLNEEELAGYNRIFPAGVREDKVMDALRLVARTIDGREERGEKS